MLIHLQMEVRQRYLFAIEDPFELDHNVARTVAHNGIVAIRDEFRRAWAILCAVGRDQTHGDFLEEMISVAPPPDLPNAADKRSTHKKPVIQSMNSVKTLPTNTHNSELVAEHADVVASLGAKASLSTRNDASHADTDDNKVIDQHRDHQVVVSLGGKVAIPPRTDASPAELYDNRIVDKHTEHHVETLLGGRLLVQTHNGV